MSRQSEWQQRMRAEGRCQICGKPQSVPGYCEVHRVKRLQRLRKKNAGGKTACGNCHKYGHNRRSCPLLSAEKK